MLIHRSRIVSLVASSLVALAGCTGETDGTSAEASGAEAQAAAEDAVRGDPSKITIGVYAVYAGRQPDCSDLIPVQDDGEVARQVNLIHGDPLFTVPPPRGSYGCVALRMSDVIRMTPETSFGHCVGGQSYTLDLYRKGQSGWVDVEGQPIAGGGTDDAPVDDHVTVFLTRSLRDAAARGISLDQMLPLGSDLTVPGPSRLTWNGPGSVVSEGGTCRLDPGQPTFE